jgi:hypothetical protein
MVFVLLLPFFSHCVTLDDIAICIWSGIEVFHTRVAPMARTWFRLAPSIHVYSDEIINSSVESMTNCTNHLNVSFHETPTFAHYMVGTQWNNRWNNVQNRHLYALGDVYFREPNKKWYLIGDDDTFVYPNTLTEHLTAIDGDVDHIRGRTFLAFEHVNSMFRNPNLSHGFAQGGAGIAIPGPLMARLAGKMENCTQIFSGVNFPSDMRLAACLERLFNYSVIAHTEGVFAHDSGVFNGDVPMKLDATFKTPPATYHHIVDSLVDQLWMAGFSLWTDNNGVDVYIDWSWLTMKEINIQLGSANMFCEFQFGFKIYLNGRTGEQLTVLSQPEPIFGDGDEEHRKPRKFEQRFEGDVFMQYVCDDRLDNQTVVFDSFLLEKDGNAFRVMCPPVRTFAISHPGKTSPVMVTRSPIHEL